MPGPGPGTERSPRRYRDRISEGASTDDLLDGLTAAVREHLGPGVSVEGLRRLTGGASSETWSFDTVGDDGARRALVLRRGRGGLSLLGHACEAALVSAAREGGVPAPHVWFVLDTDTPAGPGYVMERVAGETIPRRILRDDEFAPARPVMARQAGEIAARIHALDLDVLPDLPAPAAGGRHAIGEVELLRGLLDTYGEPHPVLEWALCRLERDATEPSEPVLVHGDFRNGNFVVGPDGIRAVLDWELAHVGDPMEDLGWLCVRSWRFRNDDLPVGGFGDYDDLFEGYESVSGRTVEPDRVRYWQALGTAKWACMCIVQAFTHLSGAARSVELAAIGRRVAEVEYHLLDELG